MIWLVGMMGAGKSAIGPILARRLGLPFIDTDAEIVRATGQSIAALFDAEGEPAFREREQNAIAAIAGREAVVALGGGAVASGAARARVAGLGSMVYLRARPQTLLSRLGDCRERPLLRDVDPSKRLERLRSLLEERREGYESARIQIDTDELGVDDVVERVVALLTPHRVAGNEADRGLSLAFDDLSSEAREHLARSLKLLPVAETSYGDDEQPALVIVSEILSNSGR